MLSVGLAARNSPLDSWRSSFLNPLLSKIGDEEPKEIIIQLDMIIVPPSHSHISLTSILLGGNMAYVMSHGGFIWQFLVLVSVIDEFKCTHHHHIINNYAIPQIIVN